MVVSDAEFGGRNKKMMDGNDLRQKFRHALFQDLIGVSGEEKVKAKVRVPVKA